MKKPAISPAERYVDELNKHLVTGISTEHTYRPALKAYVERLSKGVLATNEPKRVKCGAPDFIVTRGVVPLGYIEAKDIGESLDKAENSEQLRRYRSSLGNLILTDYVEFRWYVSGVRRLSLRVGKIAANGKIQPSQLELDSVSQLLNGFLAEQAPTIADSRELANRMAALARLIRDSISFALTTEAPSGALHEQLKSTKTDTGALRNLAMLRFVVCRGHLRDGGGSLCRRGILLRPGHRPSRSYFDRRGGRPSTYLN